MVKHGKAKMRWPEFAGWDEKAEAIETLAQACGAYKRIAPIWQASM